MSAVFQADLLERRDHFKLFLHWDQRGCGHAPGSGAPNNSAAAATCLNSGGSTQQSRSRSSRFLKLKRFPSYAKEKRMFRSLLLPLVLLSGAGLLSACDDDADIASRNLSKAADNFEIVRRVVFYNGITDSYMLTVEGRCSIHSDGDDRQLEVTCKVAEDRFKKHYLGLSDNVTYFAEQMETADVGTYHHRIIFKPQQIVPDIDFRGSAEALAE